MRCRATSVFTALSMSVICGIAIKAEGDTHYVDAKSAAPTAPYNTPKSAARKIQTAIDAANEGDTVQVAAGKYHLETTIRVRARISLRGAGEMVTTIDAGGKCAVVKLGTGCKMQGFTITGGKARSAAGVACAPGTTLSHCTIVRNEAERYGGGVYARIEGRKKPPVATIRDCNILSNRVTQFMHTDTPWGGAGVYAAGEVIVTNCLIEDNEASQRAGGIWLHGGATLAERCTIRNNRALGNRARNPNGTGSMEEGGGGAYCDFGGQLRNCLIINNHANKIGGGAVLSTNGRAKSCTIVGNTAGRSGGGVQTLGPGHVVNSIVVGNLRGDADARVSDDVYVRHYYHVDVHQLMLGKASLRHSRVGATTLHHTTQRFYLGRTAGYDPKNYKNKVAEVSPVKGEPGFVNAAKNDYRLQRGSPCIDAGLNEDWMSKGKDHAGQPRVHNVNVDVGAIEFRGEANTKGVSTPAATNRTPPRGKRLLIIGIDGLRPDALKAAKTPHLDKLIAEGAYADNTQILGMRYRKNDTISGPGWASILTGVWADKHGVNDNNASKMKHRAFPGVLERIKSSYPDELTVSLVTWRALHEQIVRGADDSRNLKPKGSKDYATADRRCGEAAVKVLTEKQPLAMLVYFGNVDTTGHARGFHPGVAPYLRAIEQADTQVGRVLAAMNSRPTFAQEDWLVLVTTDHGGKGKNHQRGQKVPEILTGFLIVSGRSAARGHIKQSTHIVDVLPTALAHLEIDIDPGWGIDGQVVGLKRVPQQRSRDTNEVIR